MEGAFKPVPERDLENQRNRETAEQAEVAEMKAALERTLSKEERLVFDAIVKPGISIDERLHHIDTFNAMRPGTPDEDEPIEGREHDRVPMNFGGTELLVSRSARGVFEIALR